MRPNPDKMAMQKAGNPFRFVIPGTEVLGSPPVETERVLQECMGEALVVALVYLDRSVCHP